MLFNTKIVQFCDANNLGKKVKKRPSIQKNPKPVITDFSVQLTEVHERTQNLKDGYLSHCFLSHL